MAETAIPTSAFQALLAKAKLLATARREADTNAAMLSIEEEVSKEKPHSIDLSAAGITKELLTTKEGMEAAIEVVSDLNSSSGLAAANSILSTSQKRHTTGVAADVSLNPKQSLFIETALSGEDLCLIGAAGTGKTTSTGKLIKRLIEEGNLLPLGSNTKHLRDTVPGVLITSFTRKAVNNIRRAVPEELQPHVLTMHKVLEFAPVFYDYVDTKTGMAKKTMRFEPSRTATNPLPSGLSLIFYEEGSMIGTDLYNLMAAALPHNPQEVFIGDIRQLPPIFGPAILGFKMSLLPVVELDEVYRQALLSPIIRLAHSVLTGDARKFAPTSETRKEKHPHLGTMVERKYVPALEQYNEEDEYGSVKLQIWQKKLPSETACNATIQQFIAWEKSGYYKPDTDVILCPFNVSFGTIELNKGIQDYLGKKRKSVVHEVIAGFEKHYLAIGDRVLYDKEDAVVEDIRRNLTYLGKTPSPPSVSLNRWGVLETELSLEEQEKIAKEEAELGLAAIDKFMDLSEDEDRVHAASHAVDIRFSYTDEVITLSSAADLNNVIGGNAITVHKMQGSEAETIFLTLHHTHGVMVNNELLYTAITRARMKLHVICEVDTFFKGVKTHKVRGVTLADKIEYFKGKVEFKDMQAEMEFLTRQREIKKRELEAKRKVIELEPEIQTEEDKFYANFDWIGVVPDTSYTNGIGILEHSDEEDKLSEPKEDDVPPRSSVVEKVKASNILAPDKPVSIAERLRMLKNMRK